MNRPAQPAPTPPDDDDRERIARFKHLTEHILPALAREHRWPIRLDHCFKRICLDHAFEDVWYNHIPRPAERHLTGDPLTRALHCAEDLATGDLTLLRARNTAASATEASSKGICWLSLPKGSAFTAAATAAAGCPTFAIVSSSLRWVPPSLPRVFLVVIPEENPLLLLSFWFVIPEGDLRLPSASPTKLHR